MSHYFFEYFFLVSMSRRVDVFDMLLSAHFQHSAPSQNVTSTSVVGSLCLVGSLLLLLYFIKSDRAHLGMRIGWATLLQRALLRVRAHAGRWCDVSVSCHMT
jgi:hypothetical protein